MAQAAAGAAPRWKALIFDVDGTLAETEEAHRVAFNRAFADWGLGWHWSRRDYRHLLKITGGKERIAAFQTGLPSGKRCLGDADIKALHLDKTVHYTAILMRGGLELRPGVRALIDRARRAGLRLAVATTTSYPNVEALCQCCWGRQAREIFEVIASGDQVIHKKPAPDIFRLALDRLGLPPADCLAFEDSQHGIASARACGLQVIVTPSLYTDDDALTGATWQLDSLAQGQGICPGLGL